MCVVFFQNPCTPLLYSSWPGLLVLALCVCRCLPCPSNQYCLQGAGSPSGVCPTGQGFDCSSGILTISPGYWSPPTSITTANVSSNTSLTAYKCTSIDSCVGASVVAAELMIPEVCGPGYGGDLCSGCDAGWASTGGGKCVQCHSKGVLILSLIVVPGAVIGIVALLVSVITHQPTSKSQVCGNAIACFGCCCLMNNACNTQAMLGVWIDGKRELLFANLRILLELLQMTGLQIGVGSFEPQWLVVCAITSLDATLCSCARAFVLCAQVTSALSGAAVGAGLSVTTWAPWICVVGDNIVTQIWAQLALVLFAAPVAYAACALSVPLSRLMWEGVPRFTSTAVPLPHRVCVSLSQNGPHGLRFKLVIWCRSVYCCMRCFLAVFALLHWAQSSGTSLVVELPRLAVMYR